MSLETARLVALPMLYYSQAESGTAAQAVGVALGKSAVPANAPDKSSQGVTNSIRLRTV